MNKWRKKQLIGALISAIQWNESLLDAYRINYPKNMKGGLAQKVFPYDDKEYMKFIHRWQWEIKTWQKLIIELKQGGRDER